jgi:ribosomal protein L24E
MMATGAFVVFPKLPDFHHGTGAKKTTNMLRNPEAIQWGKKVCHHLHSIPVNLDAADISFSSRVEVTLAHPSLLRKISNNPFRFRQKVLSSQQSPRRYRWGQQQKPQCCDC